METVSKYISKTGKISKVYRHSIDHCLKSNKIQLSSDYRQYTSNPYQLFYSINNIHDCIKTFYFSFTINHFNLNINTHKRSSNLPTLNLVFYDEVGEDIIFENHHSSDFINSNSNTQSVIVNSKSNANFNLIIGNSKEAIIDSLFKLTTLIEQLEVNTPNVTIGLFLGQINPNKYLNRSFKLHRIKDLYTTFFNTFNKFKDTNRLCIELTKSLLSLTINTDNIYLNYTPSTYTKECLDKKTIKEYIIKDKYLASYKSLLHRINLDIKLPNNSIELTKQSLQELYNKNCRGNSVVYVTHHTLLMSKKGPESCEKLLKANTLILINDSWCHIKLEEEKESSLIYLIFFTDGSCVEVTENSKFILESNEVKTLDTLVKNDKLKINNLHNISSEIECNDYFNFTCNGIVDQVVFDRTEYKLIKLTIPTDHLPYVTLANGLFLSPIFNEQGTLSPHELDLRLSDAYLDSTSLVQDSIILESRINLDELDVLNIEEQLKIFKTATLISGTSLILKEHKLCLRLSNNLIFNPTVNVAITNIQKFDCKLNALFKEHNYLDIYDDPKRTLKNKLNSSKLEFQEVDARVIRIYQLSIDKERTFLQLLATIWQEEVLNTISEYCTKHNLNVPIKITSISENYHHTKYNVIEQLDLILLFHKYYSTQNSIMTINYYQSELNKLVNKVTCLYSTEVDIPYLLFNKVD